MIIGVPKEIKNHEYRVGMTPAGVQELTARGHKVLVQQQGGEAIGLSDAEYQAAGAELVASAAEIFARAEMIVKVKEPQPEECELLRPGQLLFTYLHLAPDPEQTRALLASGCTRPITLVNGARCQSELYHHDEFVQLAQQHANFSYVAALSDEPEDSGWTGARGFVHEAAKAHFANDFRGHKAYLCGPPLMIDACITTLMQGRLFERDIYTEKFISAADAQQVRSPLFKKI